MEIIRKANELTLNYGEHYAGSNTAGAYFYGIAKLANQLEKVTCPDEPLHIAYQAYYTILRAIEDHEFDSCAHECDFVRGVIELAKTLIRKPTLEEEKQAEPSADTLEKNQISVDDLLIPPEKPE
jgi:hypothetical protein